jgi:hypothetical protein
MQKSKPNFIRLDPGLPEITILVTAMLQARAAAKHRPWSLPQEPTTESWWADVLAGPRARRPEAATRLLSSWRRAAAGDGRARDIEDHRPVQPDYSRH